MADGSVPKLATTGFDLQRDIVRAAVPVVPPAPQKLKVKRGTMPGTAVMTALLVAGATSYYVDVCTGDPTVDSNWVRYGEFESCHHIDVTKLTAGKSTHFRVCGWNKNGFGPWATSEPLTIL